MYKSAEKTRDEDFDEECSDCERILARALVDWSITTE